MRIAALSFFRPLPSVTLAMTLAALLAGCTPGNDTGTSGGTSAPSTTGGTSTGGKFVLGMMPKQKGNPYFNACQAGATKAAAELGDVDLKWEGPIQAKSEDQSAMVDTWSTQGYNGIAVACNDPDQIAPSLKAARDKGITVVTYDADAAPSESGRQFFVNQADTDAIAHSLVDVMVEQTGPDAKVAVVSSSSTAPNQSAWTKSMTAYIQQKYPKLTIVATEYAGEDLVISQQRAQDLLKANPDLKGLWGLTSRAFPGAARAVEKAGKGGKVAVVGLGLPSEMKPFVKSGTVKKVILWDPEQLGYLAVKVAHAVWKGDLKPGATTFDAGGDLGSKEVKGDAVLLGPPLVFDKDNIDKYSF